MAVGNRLIFGEFLWVNNLNHPKGLVGSLVWSRDFECIPGHISHSVPEPAYRTVLNILRILLGVAFERVEHEFLFQCFVA